MIVIKKVSKNIIDVFTGKGWENWGRFLVRFTPTGTTVKQIKGIPFNKTDFVQVEASVNIQH